MKRKFKYTIVATLLFAVSGFNSAKAITADELAVVLQSLATQFSQALANLNQVVFNNQQRIDDLENANPNLGGYSMSFSPDGAPKNVVVFAQEQGGGEITYTVRSRYATSVEQISINGVLTQRPFIANYAYIQTDIAGDLVYVSNGIEAPDTSNYVVYNVEASEYDPVSLAKTVTDDTLWEDWNLCDSGSTTICLADVSLSATGDHVRTYSWSSIRGLAGPLSFNGMNFNQVRLEQNISSDNARARAKGIGEVLRVANDGSWERRAIFYRANGVTGGSLAATPFAPGQPLDGIFF